MAVKRITSHLERLGFKKSAHPCHHSHYFTLGSQGVVIDCMKVRSYRFFLGLNCIPGTYPHVASIQRGQIDAESPWFIYRNPGEKEQAISACVSWLDDVGLPFLAAPFSKELHRWVSEEKILIRDKGIIIPIPRVVRLP
jgi:hypothetical protein